MLRNTGWSQGSVEVGLVAHPVTGSAASSGQPLSPSLLLSELQGKHRAVHVLYVNLYERDLTQTCRETRTCMFTMGAHVCIPGSVHANTKKPGRLFHGSTPLRAL